MLPPFEVSYIRSGENQVLGSLELPPLTLGECRLDFRKSKETTLTSHVLAYGGIQHVEDAFTNLGHILEVDFGAMEDLEA